MRLTSVYLRIYCVDERLAWSELREDKSAQVTIVSLIRFGVSVAIKVDQIDCCMKAKAVKEQRYECQSVITINSA